MSALQHLTDYVANTTSTLAPLTLPLGRVQRLSIFIDHITSTPVHATYYPFLRFGAIHAARVTLVWASLTQNRKRPVPLLQDMFGYLTLAWGGGTVVSLLLSTPPSWLIDPTPWLIYPPIYFLLLRTGLSQYAMKTAPALINLFGCCVDGITRGATITSLPKALSSSSGLSGNLWTTTLLSGIAVASGGWIIQTLGIHLDTWTIGRPIILSGGLWDTLDLWSGMVAGLVYAALTGSHPTLEGATRILSRCIPEDMILKGGQGIVAPSQARAIACMVLALLLALRVVVKSLWVRVDVRASINFGRNPTREEVIEELTRDSEKETAVVKRGIEVNAGQTRTTPRKGKKSAH